MNRGYLANGSATAPAAPASPAGPYPINGAVGTPATQPGAYWFHAITEELRNLIVGAGITPDHANVSQVLAAVQALAAGRLLKVTTYNTAGTFSFTRQPGTTFAIVEGVGGGGGGGGSPTTSSNTYGIGGGGAAGSYARVLLSAAQLGSAPIPVVCGASGRGAVGVNGTAGGSSSFGSGIVCTGGTGGQSVSIAAGSTGIALGGQPQSVQSVQSGTPIILCQGMSGAFGIVAASGLAGGAGGPSALASGSGGGSLAVASNPGSPASGPGGGGGGACANTAIAAMAGGNGAVGGWIIYEYGS